MITLTENAVAAVKAALSRADEPAEGFRIKVEAGGCAGLKYLMGLESVSREGDAIMHGHSYRVELRLEGPVDPDTGFVIDFFDVEAVFGPLLQRIDHQCLNQIEGLENPTAENIAVWIWDQTKPLLGQMCSVTVYETPLCWAEYEG